MTMKIFFSVQTIDISMHQFIGEKLVIKYFILVFKTQNRMGKKAMVQMRPE